LGPVTPISPDELVPRYPAGKEPSSHDAIDERKEPGKHREVFGYNGHYFKPIHRPTYQKKKVLLPNSFYMLGGEPPTSIPLKLDRHLYEIGPLLAQKRPADKEELLGRYNLPFLLWQLF
jgi:hypothetical protein